MYAYILSELFFLFSVVYVILTAD